MNDDDLLFPVDDLDLWKKRELPEDWLAERQRSLLERLRERASALRKTTASNSTNKPPITPPAAPPQPFGGSPSQP